MADSGPDGIDDVRERKMEELKRKASGERGDDEGRSGDPPDEIIHVESPEQFRDVVGRYDRVLVDFYADWCGPCKMLEPVVDDIAAETEAAVLKVDIDVHQGLARNHQVQGVPTLLVYANGEPVDRVVGVTEKQELAAKIEAAA